MFAGSIISATAADDAHYRRTSSALGSRAGLLKRAGVAPKDLRWFGALLVAGIGCGAVAWWQGFAPGPRSYQALSFLVVGRVVYLLFLARGFKTGWHGAPTARWLMHARFRRPSRRRSER
jgi:hypothetical protein